MVTQMFHLLSFIWNMESKIEYEIIEYLSINVARVQRQMGLCLAAVSICGLT